MQANKSLQATRDGALGSATRFTSFSPACPSSLGDFAHMKAMLYISVLFTLLRAACAPQRQAQPLPSVVSKQVTKGADAIAVVLADIQRRGGDPHREECSAKKMDGDWWVTAWHIWYPNNKGDSRFVPGGFTDYIVSTDGKIVRTLPGL
jgi:hypothetical protein